MLSRKVTFGLLATVGLLAALPASAQRATVAIPDFENRSGMPADTGPALGAMMTTALSDIGKFTITERSKLGHIADEQLLGSSGMIDPESAAKVGRVAGADYLLLGTITRAEIDQKGGGIGGIRVGKSVLHVAIDISFVDTETGIVKYSNFVERSDSRSDMGLGHVELDKGNPAFEGLAREIIEGLAAEIAMEVFPSRVLECDEANKTVVISYGDNLFEEGDTLEVQSESGSFKDPDTGETIVRKRTIGKIRISYVDDKYSEADIIEGRCEMDAICKLVAGDDDGGKKKKKKRR